MTDGPVTPPPAAAGSLVTRVINILTKPADEWRVIDGEATTIGKLILGYAVILAAIAPLAALLGMLLTPYGSYIFNAFGFLLRLLLVVYAISLGTVVLLGFAINLLAPSLGGTANPVQAMKLAVYSGTAFWVAAIALLLSEWLWFVIGIGYGGYLVWLGLPVLMRVAADKAQAYTAAVVGIWVVLYIVLQQIGWRIIFSAIYNAALSGGIYR